MNDIGIIGMGIMGKSISLNFARNGYKTAIFNRSIEKVKNISEKNIYPYLNLQEFIKSLKKPRIILIIVTSGKPVDSIINSLLSYLEEKDIIMDGGNSYYIDSIRREKNLKKKGINFFGVGISGGKLGALYGPSIMVDGNQSSYHYIRFMLEKISAKYKEEKCVGYFKYAGTGHYIKMIHNSIEYAFMQLIAESYEILKRMLFFSNKKISKVFFEWNKGELESYLIEICINIFRKKENKDSYLIDKISERANNNKTGSWACKSALDLEEFFSVPSEAIFFRYISKNRKIHKYLMQENFGPKFSNKEIKKNKKSILYSLKKSLYVSAIISYHQGFSLLQKASKFYGWNIEIEKVLKIFLSGCIIRSKILEKFLSFYKELKKMNKKEILYSKKFLNTLIENQKYLRNTVVLCAKFGLAVPCFYSSLSYYDILRSEKLPTNLIQAQRNYFGLHKYTRSDKKGYFSDFW